MNLDVFNIPGPVELVPFGNGHIHDTYVVSTRYILQRINHQIFKNPVAVMENIARVTDHLHKKSIKTLTLIKTREGHAFHRDEEGKYWRLYEKIEGTHAVDVVRNADQAYEAARAFGAFQAALIDLPPPRLHEVIPDFHNTPKRLDAFWQAVRTDAHHRVTSVKKEIEFVRKNEGVASALFALNLPERVTHNDTKINNVLFDQHDKAVCVIDLDTVMPGLSLYDFGDLVRTATTFSAEDETDLSKIQFETTLFEALREGYLETAGGFLTDIEKESLSLAGKVITFETGLRFLTDYLQGDVYFKTHRPGQNLDRCRTQFRLVEMLEQI